MRQRSFAWAAVVALAVCAACGGEAKNGEPAKSVSPTGGETQEPSTIEEAQAQLDRAKAQLAAAGTPAGPAAASATGTSTSAAPTAAPQSGASAGGAPASPCVTACQAIASMHRAVDAICRMAGQDDARCTDAKKTLGDSQAKVVSCGCS